MNGKFQFIPNDEKIRIPVPFDFMKSYISHCGYRILLDSLLYRGGYVLNVDFKIWKIAKLIGETVICIDYKIDMDKQKIVIGESELPIYITRDGYTTMDGIKPLLLWMRDNMIIIDKKSILDKIDQDDNTLEYHGWTIKFDKISSKYISKPIIYMFDQQYSCIISNDVNYTQIDYDKNPHTILIPGYDESTKILINDIVALFSWLDSLYIQMELLKLEKSKITIPKSHMQLAHGINNMEEDIKKWNIEIHKMEENNKQLQETCDSLLKKIENMKESMSDNISTIDKYKKLVSDYNEIISSIK